MKSYLGPERQAVIRRWRLRGKPDLFAYSDEGLYGAIIRYPPEHPVGDVARWELRRRVLAKAWQQSRLVDRIDYDLVAALTSSSSSSSA